MMARTRRSYRKSIRREIDNAFLGEALEKFVTSYRLSRANAFSDFEFNRLQASVIAHKDRTLMEMKRLLDEFTSNAKERGSHVYHAADSEEAVEIIKGIAREKNVGHIIKSKSMTTEEIQLNRSLEASGIEVTETDLGEWIIQLRDERPSHMVLPAIHLSRHQVATLFSQISGSEFDPDDIEALVRMARETLRERFLAADMGVTGANFALADSGTLALVTNEGNARLVTSLPPIHVVLMGIDKVLTDVSAALELLNVLPRSATGQDLTTYVTWINGTTPCSSAPDGLRETHIVVLDNGRSDIAGSEFRQALRCIRCGACANVCPVFRMIGGHQFGHIYVGPIGLILTYFFHGAENATQIAKNCLNCLSCKKTCPAGIDLPHLIRAISARCSQHYGKPLKNHLVGGLIGHRTMLHGLLKSVAFLQSPVSKKTKMMRLPKWMPAAHRFRDLPFLSAQPFRNQFTPPEIQPEKQKRRVMLFGGCLMDFVYPEQGHAFLKLIRGTGTNLTYPLGQGCCGLPALMMGEEKSAKKIAAQNLDTMCAKTFDYIVVLCASCGSFLKEYYPELLADDPRRAAKASALAERVIDFSSFMCDVIGTKHLSFEQTQVPTAYHAPCHLCRGLDVSHAPHVLIRASGNTYVATADEQVCCGFGGSYSLEFPEISARLVRNKLDQVEKSGARILVTDCPGCVLQLRGAEAKRGGKTEVMHTAELLAQNLIGAEDDHF